MRRPSSADRRARLISNSSSIACSLADCRYFCWLNNSSGVNTSFWAIRRASSNPRSRSGAMPCHFSAAAFASSNASLYRRALARPPASATATFSAMYTRSGRSPAAIWALTARRKSSSAACRYAVAPVRLSRSTHSEYFLAHAFISGRIEDGIVPVSNVLTS